MVQYFIFYIIRCTISYSNRSDQFSSFLYVDNWQRYCSYLYLFTMNLLQHFLGHLGNPTTVISESFENSFMHKKSNITLSQLLNQTGVFIQIYIKRKTFAQSVNLRKSVYCFFSFITGERDTESVLLLFFV